MVVGSPPSKKGAGGKKASVADASADGGRKLSVQSAAAQKIRENMNNVSDYLTDVVVDPAIEKTMRQRIEADITRERSGQKVIWGAKYYDELRKIYQEKDDTFVAMSSSAAASTGGSTASSGGSAQPVDPALMQAMIAVGHKRKRDHRKMLGYIASCQTVNESEVCGIMRWAVSLKTTCKKKQLPAAFKVVDWAVRLQINTKFPKQIEAAKPWLVNVLTKHWRAFQKSGGSAEDFVKEKRRMLLLVCPQAPLDKVITAQPDFSTVTDELLELQVENPLMEELFAAGLEALVATRVRQAIENAVGTILGQASPITMEEVDKHKGEIFVAATAVPGVHIFPGRRKIQLKYGTLDLVDVEVQSLTMEVNLRLAAAMKFHAVSNAKLDALPNEGFVVSGAPVTTWRATLGACWLKMVARSRARLSSLLASAAIASADDIANMVVKEEKDLEILDDSIRVELGVIGMLSGSAATAGCLECILKCLPSAAEAMNPETSLQHFDNLRNSSQWKVAPRASQALLSWVIPIVGGLVEEKQLSTNRSKIHTDAGSILKRIPFFIRATKGKEVLVGEPALWYVSAMVKNAVEKGQEVDTKLALQLHQFSPLLSAEKRGEAERTLVEVKKITAKNISKLQAKKKGAPSKPATGGGASSSSNRELELATQFALDMFKP